MRRFSLRTDSATGMIRRSTIIAAVSLVIALGAVSATEDDEDVTGSFDETDGDDIVYDGVPGFYPGVIADESTANRVYDGVPGFYPGTVTRDSRENRVYDGIPGFYPGTILN